MSTIANSQIRVIAINEGIDVRKTKFSEMGSSKFREMEAQHNIMNSASAKVAGMPSSLMASQGFSKRNVPVNQMMSDHLVVDVGQNLHKKLGTGIEGTSIALSTYVSLLFSDRCAMIIEQGDAEGFDPVVERIKDQVYLDNFLFRNTELTLDTRHEIGIYFEKSNPQRVYNTLFCGYVSRSNFIRSTLYDALGRSI